MTPDSYVCRSPHLQKSRNPESIRQDFIYTLFEAKIFTVAAELKPYHLLNSVRALWALIVPDKPYETIRGFFFHLIQFLSRRLQHCCDAPEIFVDFKM